MGEWGSLHFEYPYVVLFAIVFVVCHRLCPMRSVAILYAHVPLLRDASRFATPWQTVLKFIAIGALFVALASPYTSRFIDVTPKEGYDIALLLDGSLSMQARGFAQEDYRLTRFDAVKNIVTDFIAKRTQDNLGVVMFGEFAFIASPLTFDKKVLTDVVNRLEIGMAGKNTAIFDALGQGVRLLSKSEAKSKIAILLTDGRNTAYNVELDDVLHLAQKHAVKIYTIGIGMPHEIDTPLLQKIASDTNASMFTAVHSGQLEAIYDQIDTLEKSQIKSKTYEEKRYLYRYALMVSIGALMVFLLLRHHRGAL
ncbi:MAG: hypothetical protein KU37_05205 [Sulfuricurvum sp. PC08-66]|nr:MAG: hypothetical protein KU37_05205 [Sulfuricurvum sp. PC08-66]